MSPAVASPPTRIDYSSTLSPQIKLYILAGVLLGLFLAALDQTIVATALPAIVADLAGIRLLAWVSTGYLVASTAMVPIYGKLSDLYGRRAIVLFGIVVFLTGSALCGIAATMIQLVFFRVIQGVGAAALTSTAFAVPADLYPPAQRARYMGFFGAVFALSSVIGPYLGGFITDTLSWRWVFYVNVPIGAVALTLVLTKMPQLGSGLRRPIDWTGTALLILAVVPLLVGLTLDKSVYAWSSPLVVGLFVVAILSTALFILVERRASDPVLPLDLFANRTVAVVSIASVFMGAAFMASVFFLSLFMVNVVGVSATAAGSTLMPLTLAVVAGAMTSSMFVQKLGRYKFIILGGFVIAAIGFVLLARMDTSVTRWGVTWRMIVLGLGLGPAMPLLNLVIQNAAAGRVGVATGVRQFSMQIGSAVGLAIFGVVLSSVLAAQLRAGFAPLVAQLPPSARQQINMDRIGSGRIGNPGSQLDVPVQLRAAARGVVRRAFAAAVTRIYAYAAVLMVVSLLVLLALPETPLLGQHGPPAPPPPAA